ncbi:MAG: pyridoxamine 5'-phosphate oxidase family protein [Propionicimonas sp.]|nr:pyridoxamine 5'-phosphate oxidase family protein [Propionicimonas sp.]
MEAKGHNTPLSEEECRQLLRGHTLGRVSWAADGAVQILPVSYVVAEDLIVFRTASGSLLSQLEQPHQVGFEIDDLDPTTQTGWSVLVHGESGAGDPVDGRRTEPWAPGERTIVVAIRPSAYSGRAIAAS